jgi:hypothetical protein
VVVLALCDGLVTLTVAPAIGFVLPVSVTMPLMPPVVPAQAGIDGATTSNARSAKDLFIDYFPLSS